MSPRARDALRRSAENVRRAADRLRDGEPLTPSSREALVDLLDHLAGDARELLPTTVWDRTARLALRIEQPHHPPVPDLPPPNVGGGVPRS